MAQPLKKQQIIGLFGDKAGTKLINWLDPCCEEFCLDVDRCLGISSDGDPDLVLNQQGQWVSAGGGGTPSAPDQSIQYNDGGVFTGDAGFTRDPVTKATIIDTEQFYFVAGDVNSAGNGTAIRLDDSGGSVRLDANFFYIYHPSSGTQVVDINSVNRILRLGDLDGAGTLTTFTVDDSAQAVFSKSNLFEVRNETNQVTLSIYPNSYTAIMGDVGSVLNGTRLVVDPVSQAVRALTDGTFSVYNAAGTIAWFVVAPSLITIGGPGNATALQIADAAQDIIGDANSFYLRNSATAERAFEVNTVSKTVTLGDVNNASNQTKLIVDDAAQRITITNVPDFADDAAATGGGLTTGQLYKTTTGGSTFLKIVP